MAAIERAAIAAAVRALDPDVLAGERWYAAKGETPSSVTLAHAFVLGPGAVLALVDVRLGEGKGARSDRYTVPFTFHGLGRETAAGEWLPAVEGDGTWRALAACIAEGRTVPALPKNDVASATTDAPEQPAEVAAALVCRPSPGLADAWEWAPADVRAAPEQALGRDQSNTSVVIGGSLLLKSYRRVQPGLNPDLELTAYLSEEAGFTGVPRLAGWAEAVTRDAGVATVAMLQSFIAGADDVYERTAEFLADLVGAPGSASLEWSTEVAADLGTLTAGLHATLATPPPGVPDLVPREATREELKGWRLDAHRQLNLALPAVAAVDREAADELKAAAAAIAARASRFEAVATTPLVMRIHADLHLGQILVAEDGYRVIDFEGEPLRTIEDRRRFDSPLRDVASLLRSLDHVARSARRRAIRRAADEGRTLERPGLDVEAWIERARARFLAAYSQELRRRGAPFSVDLDLLDAFEVAKESYEFLYAATVLPSWLWAPREGMRWLLAHGDA